MDGKNSSDCINLRLLINKETKKVLYAEAGKAFVDLLFSFLTLPTGSIIKFVSASGRPKKVACISSLYNSVERLQSVFMNADKSHLLEPTIVSPHLSNVLKIKSYPEPTLYYVCSSLIKGTQFQSLQPNPIDPVFYSYTGIHNISTQNGALCACGKSISYQVQIKNPSQGDINQVAEDINQVAEDMYQVDEGMSQVDEDINQVAEDIKQVAEGMSRNSTNITGKSRTGSGCSGGGYVKEMVTFIISDELEISPASTTVIINLLNKLDVKDLTDLEEQTAKVGPTEALELLGASLVSTTALNDVFGPLVRRSSRPLVRRSSQAWNFKI